MGFDVRRRTVCVAVGATTLLAFGALAAQSSAARIALNASCYLNTDRSTARVTIAGRGFLPSSSVDIGGGVFGNVTTDPAGNFVTTVWAPNATLKPGARKFRVTASEDTGQKVLASTTGHYTMAGVAFSDTLPAGLVVSTPNGLAGTCGAGTITATAGSGVVSLAGGTLAASGSATIAICVLGTDSPAPTVQGAPAGSEMTMPSSQSPSPMRMSPCAPRPTESRR